MTLGWKSRLFDAYISTGQANVTSNVPDEVFRLRRAYLQHIVRRYLPPDRNARILDLGCGQGALLYFLLQAGYSNIAGVDLSGEQIEAAHRLGIPQASLADATKYIDGVEDASVDAVVAMDVLEHMERPELFRTVDRMRRILRPGGLCLARVPNAEGLYGMSIRYGDLTHELSLTANSARQLFRAAGFTRIECDEDKPVVHGILSAGRRVIWDSFTIFDRILLFAESGYWGLFTQNMLIRAWV